MLCRCDVEPDPEYGSFRIITFRAPVVAPIGPKSSRGSKTQCFNFEAKDGEQVATAESATRLLFDTSTRMHDVPYGDYFTVEEHWVIDSSHSDEGNPSVTVKVSMGIRFSKSTLWKSSIESR
jgi:hypothetical protein